MKRKNCAIFTMCTFLVTGCTPDMPSHSEVPTVPPLVTEKSTTAFSEESTAPESSDTPEKETTEFRLRHIRFPDEEYILQSAAVSDDGLIYYCAGRTDEETFENIAELYQLFPDAALEESCQAAAWMTLLSDTLAGVTSFDLMPDGGICALVCGDPSEKPPDVWDAYYENLENQWFLLRYDAAGVLTDKIDLTAISDSPESLSFTGISTDAQGQICISVLNGNAVQIWILDEAGILQRQISAERFSSISSMRIRSDGTLLLFGQDPEYCSILAELDMLSGELQEVRTFSEGEALVFCAGRDASAPYYYADAAGVYYEQAEAEQIPVFFWEDTDISGADVYWLEALAENRFAVMYTDESGVAAAVILEILDKNELKSELF